MRSLIILLICVIINCLLPITTIESIPSNPKHVSGMKHSGVLPSDGMKQIKLNVEIRCDIDLKNKIKKQFELELEKFNDIVIAKKADSTHLMLVTITRIKDTDDICAIAHYLTLFDINTFEPMVRHDQWEVARKILKNGYADMKMNIWFQPLTNLDLVVADFIKKFRFEVVKVDE